MAWQEGPDPGEEVSTSKKESPDHTASKSKLSRHWRGAPRPGERAPGDPGWGAPRERLTSEQQLPPPQVRLGSRVVAGYRADAHASALEPVRRRPAACRHLERSHPQRRHRLQQHPAAQPLPAAVRAAGAPGQLQREAAHAPVAHGAGRGAELGGRTAGSPAPTPARRQRAPGGACLRPSRGSAPFLAAPGAPERPPASANSGRRPGLPAGASAANFLVLGVRPRDAPGPPGTCGPRARAVDFATTTTPASAGRALFL